MKLPRLAIENYQFTLIGFVLLIVMGVSSFLTLPRTEDPPITIPGAGIVVIYPGTSPADLEQLVADPIEEEINELDNIKKINTTLKDGIASISVEFEFNTDADEKYDEVVRQVDNVKEELPEDIYSIDISQWTSTDVCMLQLAFVSDTAPYLRLNYQAEQLKKELEKIKGVKKVEIFAYPEEEIRIALDI